MILKVWKPELLWNEVDFSSSTFWVQVHGISSLWLNKSNLMRIGNKIGKVLDIDLVGDFQPRWQRFVRIRIEINIAFPLKPGLFLPRKNLADIWIGFKYEKCYPNINLRGGDLG